MEQVVFNFGGKKEHQFFATIKGNFVFSSIVTTNIQKTLESTNTGVEQDGGRSLVRASYSRNHIRCSLQLLLVYYVTRCPVYRKS